MASLVFNQLGSGYNSTALLEFLQEHWEDQSVYNAFNHYFTWQGNVPDTLKSCSGADVNTSTLQDYADNYDKFPYFKLADGQFLCYGDVSNPFMLFYGSSYGSDNINVIICGVVNGAVSKIAEQIINVTPFLSENFWTNFSSYIDCPNSSVAA